MRNVTDEVSNPFGMRPPCPHDCGTGDRTAVFGYGDTNADFHVIGDHPGLHGGATSGIPFTESESGERVLDVLDAVDLVTDRDPLALENCFLSYRYLCCIPAGATPTPVEYRDFERFFDAELRAIAADVLIPVGRRTTRHVIREYTATADRIQIDMATLHGQQIHGRGFLVMPMRDPRDWGAGDDTAFVEAFRALQAMDYRQMVDLGRFIPGGDPYFVR